MAVLVEGISVLVRKEAIEAKMPGGWKRFLLHVPNQTLCHDEKLARVGFMNPQDVGEFIDELAELGLTFLDEGKATDLVVCDQLRGPTTECDWLQFCRSGFGDSGGKVGMAWWWHRKTSFGVHMPAKGLQLHTPPGWEFEGSLSDKYTFVPEGEQPPRHDN